jgi:beta-mannosidase
MKKYMDRSFRTPTTFSDFVYVSQLVQAEGIRRAIEAQRRSMPTCMGSLYWQLNDVWQGASWSSIDNFGRWKALQYASRDAYANVLVSPILKKDVLEIHIVNDQLTGFEGELFVQTLDFHGRTIFMDGRYVNIQANASAIFYENKVKSLLQNESPKTSFVLITFRPKGKPAFSRTYYFAQPKDLVLEKNVAIVKEIITVEGGYNIRLTSPALLKNVFLSLDVILQDEVTEGVFSDNYFDIVPTQTYDVFLKTNAALQDVNKGLKIKSLVDTY